MKSLEILEIEMTIDEIKSVTLNRFRSTLKHAFKEWALEYLKNKEVNEKNCIFMHQNGRLSDACFNPINISPETNKHE